MPSNAVFTEKKGEDLHVPVLFQEVMEWLRPCSSGCYVDGTLGLGGHTEMILEQSAPEGRVLGFEWDAHAARFATERLAGFEDRFQLYRASYADMAARPEAVLPAGEAAATAQRGVVPQLMSLSLSPAGVGPVPGTRTSSDCHR